MQDPHALLLAEFRGREGRHCVGSCDSCGTDQAEPRPRRPASSPTQRRGQPGNATTLTAGIALDALLYTNICPARSLWITDLVRARRLQVAVLGYFASPTNCDLVGVLTISTELPQYLSDEDSGWEVEPGQGTTGGVDAAGKPPDQDADFISSLDRVPDRLLLQYDIEYWLRGYPTSAAASYLSGANLVAKIRMSYDLVAQLGPFRIRNQYWKYDFDRPEQETVSAYLVGETSFTPSITIKSGLKERLLSLTAPDTPVDFEFDEARVGGPALDLADFFIGIAIPADEPNDYRVTVLTAGRAAMRGGLYTLNNVQQFWADIASEYVYALAKCRDSYPDCDGDARGLERAEVAFGLAKEIGQRVAQLIRDWYLAQVET